MTRLTNLLLSHRVTRNANVVHEQSLSAIDRLAIAITDKVGSIGFFLIIAGWTILWTGQFGRSVERCRHRKCQRCTGGLSIRFRPSSLTSL